MIIDTHEPKSIQNLLAEKGVKFEVKTITPGDYVVGKIGIERKTLRDFFSSMIKKRLFEQLKRLKECYSSSILILEGDINEINYFKNPGAFWGCFYTIISELGIPIFFTPDRNQTAILLYTLYQRQFKEKREEALRFKPKFLTQEQMQEFLVQGLPGIGEKLSKSLLQHFGSVRNVYLAKEKDLMKVEGIGEKTAKEVTALLDRKYKSKQERL
ncbi:MAG: ERCC4 domain-containing protein [Candidatus Thermoplasmatota archaeon]|nr:ERCC4 domain-containing protein [Candidatus Thermoplasmatota archaeon]